MNNTESFIVNKIHRMLGSREYSPVKSSVYLSYGKPDESLVIVGQAKNKIVFDDNCIAGNQVNDDCGLKFCCAHHRVVTVAITKYNVYELSNADNESEIRKQLNSENMIPVINLSNCIMPDGFIYKDR